MIDLHCHILPGIDDGAGSWQESIEMCRMAAADGCEALVATPHQRRAWPNENSDVLRGLVEELQHRLGPSPRIHTGGEIHIDSELLNELERPGLSGLMPIADTRALLVEFGATPPSIGAANLMHELVVAGWTPVVAHPEFIPFLARNLGLLSELVEIGCRCQATAMSVTGDFGRRARSTVASMLDRGLIHFLASDSHSTTWRPPGLSTARDELTRRFGAPEALRLTKSNAQTLLDGLRVPAGEAL